jgi:16S rRNA (uracil1498-N3)-methyltransferase
MRLWWKNDPFIGGAMTHPDHFLFYCPHVDNGVALLDKEESRHVFSALRGAPGRTIRITDGSGTVYECRISHRSATGAQALVEQTTVFPKPTPELRVCVGLPDKDEFEELSANLAALGASVIVPMTCDYCQKPWWQEWEKQEARLHHKMIAGIKQARSAWMPLLRRPQSFADTLAESEGCPVLAADQTGAPLLPGAGHDLQRTSIISCFVGPPGAFSPEEIRALKSVGAGFVSLSENRLRTELAALLLCGLVKNAARGQP